jgi:hypothetical protein
MKETRKTECSEAKILRTWSGSREFKYYGSVSHGTLIDYGEGFSRKARVSKEQYRDLLEHFLRKEVLIGTSHDNPTKGSLGAWLKESVTRTGIASYVGPMLSKEGLAGKAGDRGEIIKFL